MFATAPLCTRCGAPFEPRRANDRRCQSCETAVAALINPRRAERSFIPVWLRNCQAKSLNGLPTS